MMAALKNVTSNGSWKTWLLGIVATLVTAAVTNGIMFQRETRESLATHTDQIKHLQMRDENIIKYLQQRIEDRTVGPPFNRPDADRELHIRDLAIERLEKRIENLEKRPH